MNSAENSRSANYLSYWVLSAFWTFTDARIDVTTTSSAINQSTETTWPDDYNATIIACGPFGGVFDNVMIKINLTDFYIKCNLQYASILGENF